MAARAWAMPAGAWPVASTITSTSGLAIMVLASSVMRVASMRASSHPTERQAARARSGDRSAMAATSFSYRFAVAGFADGYYTGCKLLLVDGQDVGAEALAAGAPR